MGGDDILVDRRKGSVRDRRLSRILLVDDDPDIRDVATLALRTSGYSVEPCASAREALDRAPTFRPDLILLDVWMPGTDGLGALAALREMEATAATPVVFMTGVQMDEIDRYRELGSCLGVIAKPFDPTALPARLEALWGRRHGRRAEIHLEEFETLRRLYLGKLPETIAEMRAAAALLAEEGWDRSTLESLRHLVHRMAGSSGLYRLPALSRSAGALEDIVKRLLTGPTWPPASSPAELQTLVKAVDRTARTETRQARPPAPDPGR